MTDTPNHDAALEQEQPDRTPRTDTGAVAAPATRGPDAGNRDQGLVDDPVDRSARDADPPESDPAQPLGPSASTSDIAANQPTPDRTPVAPETASDAPQAQNAVVPQRQADLARFIKDSKAEMPDEPSDGGLQQLLVSPQGTDKLQWAPDAPFDGNQYARKDGGWTVVTGGGGEPGPGGGHEIQDEGVALPQQAALNFIGDGVTATDNPGTGATDVEVIAGATSWGAIGGTLADQTDLAAALGGKAPVDHDHLWEDITDKPATFPPTDHNHDDRYYTEAETDAAVGGVQNNLDIHIADTNNPHNVTYASLPDAPDSLPPEPHAHDELYYREAEVDALLNGKADNGHVLDSHGDVDAANPVAGDSLIWDESVERWVPGTDQGGLNFSRYAYTLVIPFTTTPQPGEVSYNNADPALATAIYINKLDRTGDTVDQFWEEMKVGDWLNIYDHVNSDSYEAFDVVGAASEETNHWVIPVQHWGTGLPGPVGGMNVTVLWRVDPVTSHPQLTDRDQVDSHPISAITGLQAELDAKDTAIDGKVAKAGDTMEGDLSFDSFSGIFGSFTIKHNAVDDSLEFIVGGVRQASLRNNGVLECAEIHEISAGPRNP